MYVINTAWCLSHSGLRTVPITNNHPFIMVATCHLKPWCAHCCRAQGISFVLSAGSSLELSTGPLFRDSQLSGLIKRMKKCRSLGVDYFSSCKHFCWRNNNPKACISNVPNFELNQRA
jgi:hypothetical protein